MADREKPTGIKTVEPWITVCQCGEVQYKVGKRTKTAVQIECQACGAKSSVKGNVAPIRAGQDEVAFAIKERVIRPDPDAGANLPKDEKDPTLGDQGYRTFRFKISEAQDKVISRALEAIRVMNFGVDAYKSQQWQGTALEQMSAELLSGVSSDVLKVVDAMEEKVDEAAKQYKIKNPDKELTARKARKIRAASREKTMKKLGLWKDDEYTPPEPSDDERKSKRAYQRAAEKKKQDEVDETRIPDEGRLHTGISEALVEYSDEVAAGGDKRPKFLVAKSHQYGQLLMKVQKSGVLLRLDGDDRTMDGAGRRPLIYVWAENVDDFPDLPIAYDDVMGGVLEDASLDMVQIVVQGGKQTVGFATGIEEVMSDE